MTKRINYLFIFLVSILFIPRVYASFTYDIALDVDKTTVYKGSLAEIKVSLDNIQGESQGIGVCVMNISFDSSILLDSKIRTLNSWTMTTGDKYLFDTGNVAFSKSEMFVIPVKVNGNGSVKLFNIYCSDGIDEIKTNDKEIKFTVIENNASSNNQGNNSGQSNVTTNNSNTDNKEQVIKDSNANLSNIILSEGTIDFDPNITEYEVEISDFSKFEVTPMLESAKAQSVIDKNILVDNNNVVITVTAENGDTKIYTIYVKEKTNPTDNNSVSKNDNSYVPIFIVIICILVIINIVRIIKNKKK